MFVRVFHGKVGDPSLFQRQMGAWRRDLKPGAAGYLGATGGVTPDGRAIFLVRFESEAAARANSARPEQGSWWAETARAFEGEVAFHDCRDVDTPMGGGSDEAGFVQVIQGRAKDPSAMRQLGSEAEQELRPRRPDILGMEVAWHGDGGFTQAVYFRSEQAAREGEQATEADEMRRRFMDLFDGPPTFYDLPNPDLD